MQLCECCSDFDTCALEKRTHNKVMDPCEFFSLLNGYPLLLVFRRPKRRPRYGSTFDPRKTFFNSLP